MATTRTRSFNGGSGRRLFLFCCQCVMLVLGTGRSAEGQPEDDGGLGFVRRIGNLKALKDFKLDFRRLTLSVCLTGT